MNSFMNRSLLLRCVSFPWLTLHFYKSSSCFCWTHSFVLLETFKINLAQWSFHLILLICTSFSLNTYPGLEWFITFISSLFCYINFSLVFWCSSIALNTSKSMWLRCEDRSSLMRIFLNILNCLILVESREILGWRDKLRNDVDKFLHWHSSSRNSH